MPNLKPKQYRLCGYYDNPTNLNDEVSQLLSEGWELYGEPIIQFNNIEEKGTIYAQAVTKNEKA